MLQMQKKKATHERDLTSDLVADQIQRTASVDVHKVDLSVPVYQFRTSGHRVGMTTTHLHAK